MRQMEMGRRCVFSGAAAALLVSLVFMRTAVALATLPPVDVGGWRPAGISMAPETKNSSYGGTRVETTAHAGNNIILTNQTICVTFSFLRKNIFKGACS